MSGLGGHPLRGKVERGWNGWFVKGRPEWYASFAGGRTWKDDNICNVNKKISNKKKKREK